MDNNGKYVIPKRFLKSVFLVEGIGLKEIGYISVAFLIGLLLYAIFSSNKLIAIMFLFGCPLLTYFALAPSKGNYNLNLITRYKYSQNYKRSQKIYFCYRKDRLNQNSLTDETENSVKQD